MNNSRNCAAIVSHLMNYRSGVYTEVNCPTSPNHGVIIVGYGSSNGLDYWVINQ